MQLIYLAIALGVLIFAAVVARSRLPEIAERETPTAADGRPSLGETSLWSHRHFALGVATQALYIGAQVGIGAFFINLVTETWPGLTSRGGAFMLSIAAAGYLVGRFATTALMLRVSPRTILTVYGVVNLGLCLVVAAGIPRISAAPLPSAFVAKARRRDGRPARRASGGVFSMPLGRPPVGDFTIRTIRARFAVARYAL